MTAFDADNQHAPMSGLDEYLVHNHPHPVRVMWTSDPQGLRTGVVRRPRSGGRVS